MITLDTSAMFALIDRRDANYTRISSVYVDQPGPFFVPVAILAELAYLLETRLGAHVLEAVIDDLESGIFTAECGTEDFPRIRSLIVRYRDLRLGFADAAVIACAERNGGKVLTLDLRHFGVVAREGSITLLP